MRKVLIAATASMAVASLGGAAGADTLIVKAHLSGKDEAPPVAARGIGELAGQLDTDTKLFTYRVAYAGLTGPASAARFAGPAGRGKVGAPILVMSDPSSPIGGEAILTADQMAQIRKGLWYFTVATAANPDGEIRGQLREINPAMDEPSHAPVMFEEQPQGGSIDNR
jgi:CHRD domain